MNEVFLPQRRTLLQFREISRQSAYVDDDGYFAELIASIVIGIPGTTRRGVTRSSGDLADGTEVKKGYRVDPNIDFDLCATYRAQDRSLAVHEVPPELDIPEIVGQLNANACSVQLRDATSAGDYVGGLLGRTVSRDAFRESDDGGKILRLARGSLPSLLDGEQVRVCVRQERGHINFGNRRRVELESILRAKPVLVFYQHDLRGRFQVAVVRCSPSPSDLDELLDRIYGTDSSVRRQSQPYLFPDNVRDRLYGSVTHSTTALGGRLLAVGVETSSGFSVDYWDPDGTERVVDLQDVLIRQAPVSECPPFRVPRLSFDLTIESERRAASSQFFEEAMSGFYTRLEPFCRLTSTTRNMSLGNLSQHLVSLTAGVPGSRSGARGSDLIEADGAPSEVKLATGERGGDGMDTEDSPRLTLGWDQVKMLSWKRLFAVRIVDKGHGLRVLVHAPSVATMGAFRAQVAAYFDGRVNNGSGGLQYHAMDPFPHDSYGPAQRRLEFVRIADLEAGKEPRFPNPIPAV